MLLPDCTFNDTVGDWVIVFEDHESGETIKSVSTNEPKKALQEIETLFYEQKKNDYNEDREDIKSINK